MSEHLLLRIKANVSIENTDYEYQGDAVVEGYDFEKVTVADLIKGLSDRELEALSLIRLPKKDGKISAVSTNVLKEHGWVHAASMKDRAERKKLEQEFRLLDNVRPYSDTFGYCQALNLDEVSDSMIEKIASGAKIVQVVTPKSVLSEADNKKLEIVKKKKKEITDKRREVAKSKSEAKRLREIEKAKKILAEAGELEVKS